MKRIVQVAAAIIGMAGAVSPAHALPVDPSQQPPNIPQTGDGLTYTLAYDDTDRSIIYYAPKNARVALQGELPLIGVAQLPNGEAVINVQFNYAVQGVGKQQVETAIQNAGYKPVAFPYRRAKLVPAMTDFDENTESFCTEEPDPTTPGGVFETCSDFYVAVKYSKKGPSLGENLFATAHLTVMGAAVVNSILQESGDFAFQINAEYYKAGRAFEAKVRVNFSKLYENYQRVATGGVLWGKSRREFFENETRCPNLPPEQRGPEVCGVFIEYTDLVTGNKIATPALDPNIAAAQQATIDAAKQLYEKIYDELFVTVTPPPAPIGAPSAPLFGSRVRSSSYTSYKDSSREFVFSSPRAIEVDTTELAATVRCVYRNAAGLLARNLNPPCDSYWAN